MVTWESGDPEPWATLTVNLPGQRQKEHAFIDTNADSEFPTWLIRHEMCIRDSAYSWSYLWTCCRCFVFCAVFICDKAEK